MKKIRIITMSVIASLLTLCSCGEQKQSKTDALISEVVDDIQSADQADKQQTTKDPAAAAPSGIDVDLTEMSPTMIYSVIYDMMINPQDYEGKYMKVNGYFDTLVDEQTDTRYFFVVVPDATQCCAQELEFQLPADKEYPGDYPEKKQDICVSGTLGCYEEAGQMYAYINADKLDII